jgi:UbiD family decarboxylase
MLWQDLREYVDKLDQFGQLTHVAGATWQEDIGGITELMTEQKGPALLFDDIPGYPSGWRVASNLFTTPARTAIALGLDPSADDLMQRWQRIVDGLQPIAPRQVATGPILENVLTRQQIDLYKFPTPLWHEHDGGRYIGTGLCVIQQDPDTGFVNVGAYRVCILDAHTCTVFMEHGKDGDLIRRKYWARGEQCPVVISVGQEPVLTALGGPGIYHNPGKVSELEVAGYLHGSPYPVIPGPVTGLPIPAHGEIALEGYIPPPSERMAPEGPFGEWTGYYAHGRRPETVVEVQAIYHRDNPILFGLPPTRPVGGYNSPNFGDDDPATLRLLEQAGVPGVKRVFTLARPYLRVVAIEQQHAAHVDQVIRTIAPGGDRYNGHHIWILVDDDVDASNPAEVLWAIASRCAPETGVTIIPGTAIWQLDPLIPPGERSGPGADGRRRYTAHNLVLNACRPYEWRDSFPPVAVNSPALRARIRERWGHLFEDS